MTKFATFLIMFVFWVVLSGMFDGFHLSLGVLSCLLVAHFSHDLLFVNRSVGSFTRHLVGWIFYVPYLLKEIVLASVQVAYIVLHPRMLDLIDPQLIRFKTRLKRPVSKVSFAQSITLTPGTITVSVHDDEFTVYALTRSTADSLPGTMEQKVAAALEKEPL